MDQLGYVDLIKQLLLEGRQFSFHENQRDREWWTHDLDPLPPSEEDPSGGDFIWT